MTFPQADGLSTVRYLRVRCHICVCGGGGVWSGAGCEVLFCGQFGSVVPLGQSVVVLPLDDGLSLLGVSVELGVGLALGSGVALGLCVESGLVELGVFG